VNAATHVSEPKSVLLVDRSADSREVLRTVLQRRGLRIFEADQADLGLRMARQHQPDVIVLDQDVDISESQELGDRLQSQAVDHPASLIILGKARRPDSLPAGQIIAKPYHFGPLVHKIEQLAAKAA
jgi:DNA-binding response OmpR family regulator